MPQDTSIKGMMTASSTFNGSPTTVFVVIKLSIPFKSASTVEGN